MGSWPEAGGGGGGGGSTEGKGYPPIEISRSPAYHQGNSCSKNFLINVMESYTSFSFEIKTVDVLFEYK